MVTCRTVIIVLRYPRFDLENLVPVIATIHIGTFQFTEEPVPNRIRLTEVPPIVVNLELAGIANETVMSGSLERGSIIGRLPCSDLDCTPLPILNTVDDLDDSTSLRCCGYPR